MRILVVDDDRVVAEALSHCLTAAGYGVDVASDGPEAQWFAAENCYDAIVLDWMLPELPGESVCRALRDAGDWTPILVLTARTGERPEAEVLDAGADDYLAKPFSVLVLLARLRALVRRAPGVRPTVLQVGDLRLDPSTHQAWRGPDLLDLTPRQFSVLEYFMRHPGEVLAKRAILDNVWNFAFEGDPNIVEVYVRQLRIRVDEPFGRHALRTVRLVGYQLAADGG